MVSGWYGHIMAVKLGNIVQDPTNQFTHTHMRCAVLARHSAAGRAQLLGVAACSSQSSESRRDGRTHAVNTRVPRILTHSVKH